MVGKNEQDVYDILNLLEINYVRYEHPPVYTVNEAKELKLAILGGKCKNLFLKSKKEGKYYLVIVEENKRLDLKLLARQIGTSGLSFASAERLYQYLKLTPGSVTPFGIINDADREVTVLIDKDLMKEEVVNFHPNVNTATIGISFFDFEKFIKWHENEFYYVEIKS
ncbi:prolyl-tRNA synthetase associated domain-containing protein [Clostridium aminobutyricum]|uniref:Prolyl-tRNA synthetase associated domain-containing protein n=1 Tax=Clostridium aminobutyricum TaxID=33953 RepID=A0A939IGL1_CLOAM|nr:prolyl-tRNA synthetase associated domain-containing protein [Clostridium aminobutyricum]MBN7773485.1 prolyl-tRNA synthetase associated domain-containing protein [Clostridium aminobutyricum]